MFPVDRILFSFFRFSSFRSATDIILTVLFLETFSAEWQAGHTFGPSRGLALRHAAHFPAVHSSANQPWSFRISFPARRALKTKQNHFLSFLPFPRRMKFDRTMRQLNGLAPIVDNFLGNSDKFAFFSRWRFSPRAQYSTYTDSITLHFF